MRQLDYNTGIKTRRPNIVSNIYPVMPKKFKPEKDKKIEDEFFENLQLKKRIAELERQLKDAELIEAMKNNFSHIGLAKLCGWFGITRQAYYQNNCKGSNRSATSVGANYRAVNRARSHKEFISKLSIVLEESDETHYWLELINLRNWLPSESLSPLIAEANELTAIFVSILKTVKERMS